MVLTTSRENFPPAMIMVRKSLLVSSDNYCVADRVWQCVSHVWFTLFLIRGAFITAQSIRMFEGIGEKSYHDSYIRAPCKYAGVVEVLQICRDVTRVFFW